MKVPGVIYSIILAVGAGLLEYFTTGLGAGVPWGPIILAAIPIVLKLFTVNAPEQPTPQADIGGGPLPQRDSKLKRLMLG